MARQLKAHGLYEAVRRIIQAQRRGKPLRRIRVATKKGDVTVLNPTWSMASPMDIAGDIEVRVAPRYQVRMGNVEGWA